MPIKNHFSDRGLLLGMSRTLLYILRKVLFLPSKNNINWDWIPEKAVSETTDISEKNNAQYGNVYGQLTFSKFLI